MAFYLDMQAMVRELLLPDTAGGLGQTGAVLTRTVPGVPDPEMDWVEVPSTSESEALLASVSGAADLVDGTTILAGDFRVVAAVPTIDYLFPDGAERARLSLTLNGRPCTIVRVRNIPPIGTPVAVEFIARW